MPTTEACRELDALVAEKVMGWTLRVADDRDDAYSRSWITGPNEIADSVFVFEFQPSTDIGAAWQVVERMRDVGFTCELHDHRSDRLWSAFFYKRAVLASAWMKRYDTTCEGETAPLAICCAALAAVERPKP